MEGALTLALPKFVQMGFIVPDVTKTLEEERVEEVQRMGKIKDKRTREREREREREMERQEIKFFDARTTSSSSFGICRKRTDFFES